MSRRDTGFPATVVELIWLRDKGCCARCGKGLIRYRRGEDWAIHHRSPRGMGGAGTKDIAVNLASNGVILCTACHEWVEKHRDEARDQGWLVSRLSRTRPREIAVLHVLHGLVRLTDNGQVEAA